MSDKLHGPIQPGKDFTLVVVITCRHCGCAMSMPKSDYGEPFEHRFVHAKDCPLPDGQRKGGK